MPYGDTHGGQLPGGRRIALDFVPGCSQKEVLGQTDFIDGSRAVFNVGGNKFRIVADVVFRYQIVLVRHVFTHKEYDAWNKAQRQGR
jgi:mRNA-degrading endonuclease HigB of HigAB toxin-antitoxin module